MNRRHFLGLLGAVATVTVVGDKLKVVCADPQLPHKFGGFDVEHDGLLAYHGMTVFPIYDTSGTLTARTSYRLIGENLIEAISV